MADPNSTSWAGESLVANLTVPSAYTYTIVIPKGTAPPTVVEAADAAFRRLWRAFLLLACQFVVVAIAAVWGWAR